MKPSLKPLLLLLLISSNSMASGEEFKDFSSKGPDYKPLEDILLKADDIRFEGIADGFVGGKSYPASVFAFTATVSVQTMCAFGAPELNTYANALADYEIQVIADDDRSILDALIQETVYLARKKDYPTYDHPYNRHVFQKDGKYVFYISSSSELENDAFVFWVEGKYIKTTFKGFRDGGGFGVISSFLEHNLRLRIAGTEIVPKRSLAKNYEEVIKLYKKGVFNKK